ncbi:hypothetical protein Ancab_029650 [Ancistrocladus abbreviatus]
MSKGEGALSGAFIDERKEHLLGRKCDEDDVVYKVEGSLPSPVSKQNSANGSQSKVVEGLSIGPEMESLFINPKGNRKIKALWTSLSTEIGWSKGDIKRKKKCKVVGRKGSA